MGLGKTMRVLALLLREKQTGVSHATPTLLIVHFAARQLAKATALRPVCRLALLHRQNGQRGYGRP